MFNELTEVDIKKMQEEIDYRMKVVRPKCIEDLKTARGFGDLSENYEYKAAKQELRRCDSRLRYLRRMIATAKVVKSDAREGVVGLFDKVAMAKEEKMVPKTSHYTQDQLQRLAKLAKREGVGEAILLREALDLLLKKYDI